MGHTVERNALLESAYDDIRGAWRRPVDPDPWWYPFAIPVGDSGDEAAKRFSVGRSVATSVRCGLFVSARLYSGECERQRVRGHGA